MFKLKDAVKLPMPAYYNIPARNKEMLKIGAVLTAGTDYIVGGLIRDTYYKMPANDIDIYSGVYPHHRVEQELSFKYEYVVNTKVVNTKLVTKYMDSPLIVYEGNIQGYKVNFIYSSREHPLTLEEYISTFDYSCNTGFWHYDTGFMVPDARTAICFEKRAFFRVNTEATKLERLARFSKYLNFVV